MTFSRNLNINIEQDLKDYLLQLLNENHLSNSYGIICGNRYSETINKMSLEDLIKSFLKLKSRLIRQQKYHVYMSKELKSNPLYRIFAQRIHKLKRHFKSGKDIRGFLSTNVNDFINTEDGLLRDWGIHHLHFEKSFYRGSKKRTNEILFVMIQNNNVYFIDIFKHNDWLNLEALKIIYRNWEKALEPFELKNITPDVFTEEQFKNLRKNDVGYAIGFDNKNQAYSPSLNPYSNLNIMSKSVQLLALIEKFEQSIKENKDNIFAQTITKLNKDIQNISIKVKFDSKNHVIQYYDESLKTAFMLDDILVKNTLLGYGII